MLVSLWSTQNESSQGKRGGGGGDESGSGRCRRGVPSMSLSLRGESLVLALLSGGLREGRGESLVLVLLSRAEGGGSP